MDYMEAFGNLEMAPACKERLAVIARLEAQRCWHGSVMGVKSNLGPIIKNFPRWKLKEAESLWCAAFVYYCCLGAGYVIPVRPEECVSCNLAGCGAWEEWAKNDNRIGWLSASCLPQPGHIVIFDKVFENKVHDHIGIVLGADKDRIVTAEGNLNNVSGVMERPRDSHIRGYISLPDGFVY